jgi:hypothetical protein
MKGIFKIVLVFMVIVIGLMTSCKDETKPNYQFFPNMYQSPSYETYGEYEIFADEQSHYFQ